MGLESVSVGGVVEQPVRGVPSYPYCTVGVDRLMGAGGVGELGDGDAGNAGERIANISARLGSVDNLQEITESVIFVARVGREIPARIRLVGFDGFAKAVFPGFAFLASLVNVENGIAEAVSPGRAQLSRVHT